MASKRDREKLRSRVKAQLDEEGRSQKDLESALGMSAGTLTRVFSGKKNLDAELLASIAEGLDADPAALVEGTAWAALVDGSTPPAEADSVDEDATEAGPEPVAVVAATAPAEPRKDPPKKEPAREEPPRRDPPRIEPPPTRPAGEGRKARKRDLPSKALRFLTELIFG